MTISALPRREQRGSRARCVLLTDGQPQEVASRLSRISAPFASIDAQQHFWMPRGFTAPEEARLGDTTSLLSPEHREIVTSWWLAVRGRANTPNWDIASTASVDGTQGLVLMEAKAHAAELKRAGHGIRNQQNLARIRGALEKANKRIHRTTGEVPEERFERDERHLLSPLASGAYLSVLLPPEPIVRSTATLPIIAVEKRPLSAYAAVIGGAL